MISAWPARNSAKPNTVRNSFWAAARSAMGGRLAVWVRLGKRALQGAQVLAQGRVQSLIQETPEWLQIVCKRPALQCVKIRLTILGTNGDRRIAASNQHEVHQQTRGAPVAVAEGMNRSQPKMRLDVVIFLELCERATR